MQSKQRSAPPLASTGGVPGHFAATGRALGWIAAAARATGEYGAAGIGLFGILIMWAGLFYSLSVEREAAINKAFDDTKNYARAFGCALHSRGRPIAGTPNRLP